MLYPSALTARPQPVRGRRSGRRGDDAGVRRLSNPCDRRGELAGGRNSRHGYAPARARRIGA